MEFLKPNAKDLKSTLVHVTGNSKSFSSMEEITAYLNLFNAKFYYKEDPWLDFSTYY